MNITEYKWTISKFNIVLIVNISIFLLLSYIYPKSMFDGAEYDGFYSQIRFIAEGDGNTTSPLYPVHLLRYYVVFPFYKIFSSGLPQYLESLLILLFLMPVLLARFRSKRVLAQSLFVYLPLLFSYRSVLVMCSISYLFICLYGDKKSNIKLLISILLANLSSGVVLAWVLIVIMNIRQLSRRYSYIRIVSIFALIVLGFSIIQKAGFFYNELEAGTTILERSTFYVSIVNQQYLRFSVYSLLLVAWVVISLTKLTSDAFSWRLYSFYLPMFVTFFFEGIGLISFVIPLLWFYFGVRPANEVIELYWFEKKATKV